MTRGLAKKVRRLFFSGGKIWDFLELFWGPKDFFLDFVFFMVIFMTDLIKVGLARPAGRPDFSKSSARPAARGAVTQKVKGEDRQVKSGQTYDMF